MKRPKRLTKAMKFDGEKLRYDLIPAIPLALLAKVYTVGARKYDDRNWEKGLSYSRIYGAIQRHLNLHKLGEDIDKETQVPHVINAAFGCFALAEYLFTKAGKDDRVKQQWFSSHELLAGKKLSVPSTRKRKRRKRG